MTHGVDAHEELECLDASFSRTSNLQMCQLSDRPSPGDRAYFKRAYMLHVCDLLT